MLLQQWFIYLLVCLLIYLFNFLRHSFSSLYLYLSLHSTRGIQQQVDKELQEDSIPIWLNQLFYR